MSRWFEAVDKSPKDSFPSIFKSGLPSLLYHYTSFESAQKILEGNSVRFTHVKFMNDQKEMRHGLTMFYNLVQLMIKSENDERIRFFLLVLFCSIVATVENEKEQNGLYSWLKDNCFDKDNPDQHQVISAINQMDIYVACFSTEKAIDSLPMWYMYAAHGTGVCLGFDRKKLIEAHQKFYTDRGFPEPFYSSCFYGPEGTEKISEFKCGIANFINNVSNLLKQHYSNSGITEELNNAEFLELTMYYVIVATLAFKHGAFDHEREWRLFALNRRDNIAPVRFDENNLPYMVPYLLIQYNALAKDLLKAIWLGPANSNEADTAKTFFSQKSGKTTEIIKSQIPFRKI